MSNLEEARRQRVTSCLRVIQQVRGILNRGHVGPGIVEQLGRLDRLLSLLDTDQVTDSDLDRIETSTNQLMEELALLFSHKKLGEVHRGSLH